MTEPETLTDEQVAELKALSQADLDSIAQDLAEGGTHPFDGDECVYCKKDRGVVALANEVQQARARRCGGCRHFFLRRECKVLGIRTVATWGCMDFEARQEQA